jgi:hypothetical protein
MIDVRVDHLNETLTANREARGREGLYGTSALTSRKALELLFEDLKVTGHLFAIAADACASVDRILDELVPSTQGSLEHVFLSARRRPSYQCCNVLVSLCIKGCSSGDTKMMKE